MKNQSNFLDPKKNQVLITPDYLKDHFINLKYYLLPENIFKRKFLIFINLKFLRKIRIIINLIFKAKFILSEQETQFLIFDDVGSEIF